MIFILFFDVSYGACKIHVYKYGERGIAEMSLYNV